eukprot:TRINITY_DN1066_c0_g1_i10.p1 TRINITY_DN1066_c0_g1~~TRINITY_DN1066_c0_g1_i10.p1  ORF type:complete len:694 (-),score=138.77 TRINITY_DN1066_c0_g1_i10:1395-3476(-)
MCIRDRVLSQPVSTHNSFIQENTFRGEPMTPQYEKIKKLQEEMKDLQKENHALTISRLAISKELENVKRELESLKSQRSNDKNQIYQLQEIAKLKEQNVEKVRRDLAELEKASTDLRSKLEKQENERLKAAETIEVLNENNTQLSKIVESLMDEKQKYFQTVLNQQVELNRIYADQQALSRQSSNMKQNLNEELTKKNLEINQLRYNQEEGLLKLKLKLENQTSIINKLEQEKANLLRTIQDLNKYIKELVNSVFVRSESEEQKQSFNEIMDKVIHASSSGADLLSESEKLKNIEYLRQLFSQQRQFYEESLASVRGSLEQVTNRFLELESKYLADQDEAKKFVDSYKARFEATVADYERQLQDLRENTESKEKDIIKDMEKSREQSSSELKTHMDVIEKLNNEIKDLQEGIDKERVTRNEQEKMRLELDNRCSQLINQNHDLIQERNDLRTRLTQLANLSKVQDASWREQKEIFNRQFEASKLREIELKNQTQEVVDILNAFIAVKNNSPALKNEMDVEKIPEEETRVAVQTLRTKVDQLSTENEALRNEKLILGQKIKILETERQLKVEDISASLQSSSIQMIGVNDEEFTKMKEKNRALENQIVEFNSMIKRMNAERVELLNKLSMLENVNDELKTKKEQFEDIINKVGTLDDLNEIVNLVNSGKLFDALEKSKQILDSQSKITDEEEDM